MVKYIIRNGFLTALVACLLTVAAGALGDPADVSDPNYFTGDTGFYAVIDENHALWTHGRNKSGQIGNGTFESVDAYFKVMDGVASVSSFDINGYTTVAAVKTDGSLWTWGASVDGRLGYACEDTVTEQPTPKKVMDGVTSASATDRGVLVIKNDGSLWLLSKERIQIASGNVIYASTMTDDVGYITSDHTYWAWNPEFGAHPIMSDVKMLGGGSHTFYVLKTDNTLWGYGRNGLYQMGDGTRNDYEEWGKLMDGVSSFHAGEAMVNAVKTDGSLWVWGANYRANNTKVDHGLDTVSAQTVPVQVSSNVKKAVGDGYFLIKPDGTVHEWKYEEAGIPTGHSGFFDKRLTDLVTPVRKSAGDTGRFEDVRTSDYFYDTVNWAVENGITSGRSETRFAPYDTCTVGEAIIFIWRTSGQPEPTVASESRWLNLEEDDYRYEPYNWSLDHCYYGALRRMGLPNAPCTRLIIVNMLWYAAGKPEPANSEGQFTDVNWEDTATSKAVAWAVENGITSGAGNNTFSPNAPCTRAQIVTFLQRYAAVV